MEQFDDVESRRPLPAGDHLDENQARLMDFADGKLPVGEQALLERHVADCPKCQALCAEWAALDSRLAAGIRLPGLSGDFDARLWRAIDQEGAAMPAEAKAAAKARIQAEADAQWEKYRGFFLRTQLPGLVDGLGYGAAAAALGAVLYRGAGLLASVEPGRAAAASINEMAVPLAVAAALVFLAATTFVGARTQVTRWLAAL